MYIITSSNKKKNIIFTVSIDMFASDIVFLFGDIETSIEALTKFGIDKVSSTQISKDPIIESWGYTIRFSNEKILIALPSKPIIPEEFGTLSHEIFHACSLILDRAGIELCSGSNEVYAYSIGYVTSEVFKKLKIR